LIGNLKTLPPGTAVDNLDENDEGKNKEPDQG
jgi:hypothetical protein